ncbi:MAG: hypothetical protein KID00_07480 [Clostridium argentinense]|uniref:Uncharacterized protein n=1 Tax=Clostridium faecium TaxID=2762223 RepID=A0ABR8YTG3_9CLOT|nr:MULTISPECIES: hypothetical protein [Clostridium]MBD8047545.1 hypothetical protein [Clostridium faecium]MBS5823691.1 hypothetical protein [Clostridium argentinense]MDU1348802.1 hypothetical protein [Clostridium argentinense]
MGKYLKLKIELSKNYKEIAVIIAKDYVIYGSYYKLSLIYKTSKANLHRLVKSHLTYIKDYYPEVYKEYSLKIKENNKRGIKIKNKKSEETRRNTREYLVCFDSKIFEELPKQIEYDEFLSWCIKFNTGNLTGVDLVSIAAKNGIEVIN